MVNDKNNKNIFDKYKSYYERLSVFNNDSYSYIYEHKGRQNEMNYSEQLDEWNKLIKEEYQNEGLKMLYRILERTKTIKIQQKVFFENQSYFYDAIIKDLSLIITKEEKDENEQKKENQNNYRNNKMNSI